ncbi:putative secreted protein (Por secretion system target) [Dysgonomonas alginatilytica]|uniref:Putative secreted protein (Por secretion system target) n=1 Tax=Dysgonomonas alginatilytica TaxID=1605892 RepID=A0A2V3PWE2_9BACT|nr:leucine-rich repeat protein [Dysgonomonas alginatilytica]PXV69236.1 putative secreted protein (Por secretion system target) [Dysgonomonas alginatilytica]
MKNKLFLTLLSVFLSLTYSYAQLSKTIVLTQAGTLSQQLGTDKTKVTDLVLSGTINDADFQTLKGMTLLQSLDMSGTSIASKTIPGSTFAGKTFANLVLSSTLETISNNVFDGAVFSQPLVFPSSLKSIGANAFKNATVEKLDFSSCNNLQSVANWAFVGLSSTQSLDLSECTSLTGFGSYAFQMSTSRVILPANLVTLSAVSFSGFSGTVVLPSTLEAIGNNAFENAVLSQPLVLPSSLKSLAINAFKNATVEKLDFSLCSSLQSVGNWAFNGLNSTQPLDLSRCTALTGFGSYVFQSSASHVILPANMVNLSVFSFSGFNGTVDLPSTLEVIGNNAFNGANLSKGIVLPASLKSIGISAFANSQIDKIETHTTTPPTLGATVFTGVNTATCKLYVPEGSVALYQAANQWKDFSIEANVPEGPKVGSFKIAFLEKGAGQLLDTNGGTYSIRFPDGTEKTVVTGESYFGEPLENLSFGEYIVTEINPPTGYKPSEHKIQSVNLNENNLYDAAVFEYEKISAVTNNGCIIVHFKDLLGNELAVNDEYSVFLGRLYVQHTFGERLGNDIQFTNLDYGTHRITIPRTIRRSSINYVLHEVKDYEVVNVDDSSCKEVTFYYDDYGSGYGPEKGTIKFSYHDKFGYPIAGLLPRIQLSEGSYVDYNSYYPVVATTNNLDEIKLLTGVYKAWFFGRMTLRGTATLDLPKKITVPNSLDCLEYPILAKFDEEAFLTINFRDEDGQPINGVEFGLGLSFAPAYYGWESFKADGSITLNVPAGENIKIKLYSPLPQWEADAVQNITVFQNNHATIDFSLKKISDNNTLRVQFVNKQGCPILEPPHRFLLASEKLSNGNSNYMKEAGEILGNLEPDGPGTYLIHDLPTGWYTIGMISAPHGYLSTQALLEQGKEVPPSRFYVSGDSDTYKMVLEACNSITIYSKDKSTGELLAGGVYEITGQSYGNIDWDYYIKYPEEMECITKRQVIISDSPNPLILDDISSGDWNIHAIGAPEGYMPTDNSYTWLNLYGNQWNPTHEEVTFYYEKIPVGDTPALRGLKIETPEQNFVSIYPNPVSDNLYLNSDKAVSEVQIYSTNGKMVFKQANVGSFINVGHLASGTYVLKLQIEGKIYTHKMIKK